MKNKEDILPQTLNLHLPEDLIIQILLRLPVRSLLSFKCVCKSWFSLISDPQFAKSHFDMALAPTHRLLKEYNYSREDNRNSVDIDAPLDDNSAKVVFDIPLPSPTPKYGCITDIVGSCRGLVLITSQYLVNDNFLFEFVVCNPLTGFQKRMKEVAARRVHNTGFGYDSSTDDYVVVNLRWRMCLKVEWFSFRTSAWTRLPDTLSYAGPIENAHGVLLNEALHWLVMSDDDLILIIAFDVRVKRLSEIALPYAIDLEYEKVYLKVMGGCLCFCVIEKGYGTTMWTMKQYKVQSSWIKSFVPSSNCDPLLFVFYPICSTRNGEVLGSNGNTFMRLNDKGELLEHHTPKQKFDGVYTESLQKFRGFCIRYCVHTESLLSPSGEFEKVTKF